MLKLIFLAMSKGNDQGYFIKENEWHTLLKRLVELLYVFVNVLNVLIVGIT